MMPLFVKQTVLLVLNYFRHIFLLTYSLFWTNLQFLAVYSVYVLKNISLNIHCSQNGLKENLNLSSNLRNSSFHSERMNAFMVQFLKATGRPDNISLRVDRPLYGHQTRDEASVLDLPGFQYCIWPVYEIWCTIILLYSSKISIVYIHLAHVSTYIPFAVHYICCLLTI